MSPRLSTPFSNCSAQHPLTTSLDQEGKIIAEILTSYRDLVNFATEPITNKTSTGQASYNSMAMDLETQTLVRDPTHIGALLSHA